MKKIVFPIKRILDNIDRRVWQDNPLPNERYLFLAQVSIWHVSYFLPTKAFPAFGIVFLA